MLNEERVILMTKMTSYEETEGRKNMATGRYFRSDYISIQVIKAVINATFAYAVMFAIYILYDLENFMQNIYKIDLLAFGKEVLTRYVIWVAAYTAACYLISTIRYSQARRSLRRYYNNLKKLGSLLKTGR